RIGYDARTRRPPREAPARHLLDLCLDPAAAIRLEIVARRRHATKVGIERHRRAHVEVDARRSPVAVGTDATAAVAVVLAVIRRLDGDCRYPEQLVTSGERHTCHHGKSDGETGQSHGSKPATDEAHARPPLFVRSHPGPTGRAAEPWR